MENSDLDNKNRFTDILEHIVIDLVCGFMGVEGVIKSRENLKFFRNNNYIIIQENTAPFLYNLLSLNYAAGVADFPSSYRS